MEWDFVKVYVNDIEVVFDGYFGTAYQDGHLNDPLHELDTVTITVNEYVRMTRGSVSLSHRINQYDSNLDSDQQTVKDFRENRLSYMLGILDGINKIKD
jgi:hypothetical protein